MKKLKDHVILYDAECPLCNLYTSGFIKAGMLEQNGRLPYQNFPDNLSAQVDKNRFLDEIALVNTTTGTVDYGVKSLMKILGYACPAMLPIFRNRTFFKMADTAYKLISFNRRVIIPAKRNKVDSVAFEPSFNRSYRVAYLIFTVIFTAFILAFYGQRMGAILPPGNPYRGLLICSGQVFWQTVFIRFIDKKKTWDYLGNMMTISFAGALLLLLGACIAGFFELKDPMAYAGYFGWVVFLMFAEHIRRTRLLSLSWRLTASWVLYRVIVLNILLIFVYDA